MSGCLESVRGQYKTWDWWAVVWSEGIRPVRWSDLTMARSPIATHPRLSAGLRKSADWWATTLARYPTATPAAASVAVATAWAAWRGETQARSAVARPPAASVAAATTWADWWGKTAARSAIAVPVASSQA